jgi:hypothetical protein
MTFQEDLNIAIEVNDPSRLVDGCGCDPDVGHVCECCFTHSVLCECRRATGGEDPAQLRQDRNNLGTMLRRVLHISHVPKGIRDQAVELLKKCCPEPDILRDEKQEDPFK